MPPLKVSITAPAPTLVMPESVSTPPLDTLTAPELMSVPELAALAATSNIPPADTTAEPPLSTVRSTALPPLCTKALAPLSIATSVAVPPKSTLAIRPALSFPAAPLIEAPEPNSTVAPNPCSKLSRPAPLFTFTPIYSKVPPLPT